MNRILKFVKKPTFNFFQLIASGVIAGTNFSSTRSIVLSGIIILVLIALDFSIPKTGD